MSIKIIYKKATVYLFAVAILFMAVPVTVSAAPDIDIIYTVNTNAGDTINVTISTTGNVSISTLGLRLYYDKEKLTYRRSQWGKSLQNSNSSMTLVSDVEYNGSQILNISMISDKEYQSGSELVTLVFSVKENYTENPFKLELREITNENLQSMASATNIVYQNTGSGAGEGAVLSGEVTLENNTLTYGETLSKLIFHDATFVDSDKKAVDGSLAWKNPEEIPNAGTINAVWVFTPSDAQYKTLEGNISIIVKKAVPYIATLPTASSITYGDALAACTLSGGIAQYGNGSGQAGNGTNSSEPITGIFTWKEPSIKPTVSDSEVTEYTIVFTPDDIVNYETAEGMIKLTVQKAEYAPNMPDNIMDVSNSIKNVSDVALPEGWEWQDADNNKVLETGMEVKAVAVYIGVDRGNYKNETVMITITRSVCDHVAGGEVLYTGLDEKAPTCTGNGLGHKECIKCGTTMETGIVVPLLGHNYTDEVTKLPTASAEGEKTYTCSKCGDTYTESIPRTTPEGLWINGLQQSFAYTGSAIKPEDIRVYHGSTLLREKMEYTLSYKNNTKVGTAQVIVTGKGSYKGKTIAEFTIEAVDLNTDANISASIATVTETGRKLKPTVTVTWNGKKLKEKTDYTLIYDANIKKASTEGYDVTISGTGNYQGSIIRKFRVVPKGTALLNNAKVTGLAKSYLYQEGKEIPDELQADLEKVSVKIGKKTLAKDVDYTVRVENGNTVGTGNIVLKATQTSTYAGEKRISFSIIGTNLKKCYVTGLEKIYFYTGVPIMPEIKVYTGKNGTGTQIPSDAYTVQYSNYVNQGKATATITGNASKGYSGRIKATYDISKLNLATEESTGNIKVAMPDDIKYAKGGAKPQPVITHTDSGTLREGVDYTLKYSNNTSAGGEMKPTLKITGIGNYCGTVMKDFDIGVQDIGTLEITVADKAYNRNKKGSYYYSAPKVYDNDGKQLKPGKDYVTQYTNAFTSQEIGKKDIIENGTEIRVTVTAAEKSNYTGTLSTTYYVRDAKDVKDISKAKYDKIASKQYTGIEIRPEVSLYTLTKKAKNYLTQEDYEVIGYYNNIKKGTATILIRGTNSYSGAKSVTFKITAVDTKSIWSGIFF